MRLLIVDDEEYVIESIRKNITWEEQGINEIYTAFSMKQAQNIMEMVSIDIIISDIVMPGASGFDFIQWVREKSEEPQVIFLTSYAEFDYARNAILLNSVDYLLKPIDFSKLKSALNRAVNNACKIEKIRNFKEVSREIEKNKTDMKKDIWKKLLNGSLDSANFFPSVKSGRLDYTEKEWFGIFLLSFARPENQNDIWDKKTLEFILENVLVELYEPENVKIDTLILKETGGCSYIIICRKQKESSSEYTEKELKIMEHFIIWLAERMHRNIWCGMGKWTEISSVFSQYKEIENMRESSLSIWNKVLILAEFQKPENIYANLEQNIWRILLEKEQYKEFLEYIKNYLKKMESKKVVTKEILMSFRTDITQAVYTWLDKKGIQAHALFAEKENETRYQNSLFGIREAEEYAVYLIKKAEEYGHYADKAQTVAEKVIEYVDHHYREEIRREEIAEKVYLNSDYLSRIFKKETGMSISTYILKKRVEEAQKLLTESNLPINTVALYVGYSNFSYFTKMFKDNTGMAPLEYRRNERKSPKW